MGKILDANKVLKHERVEFNRALVKAERKSRRHTREDAVDIAKVTQAQECKFKEGLETAVKANRRKHVTNTPPGRIIPQSSFFRACPDDEEYG